MRIFEVGLCTILVVAGSLEIAFDPAFSKPDTATIEITLPTLETPVQVPYCADDDSPCWFQTYGWPRPRNTVDGWNCPPHFYFDEAIFVCEERS